MIIVMPIGMLLLVYLLYRLFSRYGRILLVMVVLAGGLFIWAINSDNRPEWQIKASNPTLAVNDVDAGKSAADLSAVGQ